MRKLSCASIALVLLAVAGRSFALTFSMGAGIAPTYSSSELTASASGGATDRVSSSVSLASKLFFDITYAEIDIGYMIDHGSTPGVAATITAPSFNGEATYFTIAGFAKYPIDLGGVLIFPLLGAQLNLNLTLTDASGNDLKAGFTPAQQADLNELWLMGGVGADVILGRFFLRPEVLVGFKPLSSADSSSLSALQNLGLSSVSLTYLSVSVQLLVGARL